jgi:subtilisin family serine protease
MRLCSIAVVVAVLSACVSAPPLAQRELPALARSDDGRLVIVAVRNKSAGAVRSGAGSTLRGYSDTGPYAVSDQARRDLQKLAGSYHLEKISEWPIELLEMHCVVFEIPATANREQLLASLKSDPRVQLAQPLQLFATQTEARSDSGAGVQSALMRMDIPGAQRRSLGAGVRVAVIDTGLDASHPDLAGRVEVERNFVDADTTQFQLDRHGTAVAGVIAANNNNGVGLIGVAPQAHLLALKACWQLEAGKDAARCNSYTLAQALDTAIELHAQVINLSLTGPVDPLLDALAQRANAQGIVVVGPGTAAGATTGFPAAVPGVLGVVRTEAGAAAPQVLRAPGSDVLTLAPGGHYELSSGDSIATAAISGVTALLLAQQPKLRGAAVHQLLSDATDTVTTQIGEQHVVNACKALSRLSHSSDCLVTRTARN